VIRFEKKSNFVFLDSRSEHKKFVICEFLNRNKLVYNFKVFLNVLDKYFVYIKKNLNIYEKEISYLF